MPVTALAIVHFRSASKTGFICNRQRNSMCFFSVSPGGYPAPYSQAAYDGSQAPYPLNPPVQPSYAHPPPPSDYNAAQLPYNPAYVELPKTGY